VSNWKDQAQTVEVCRGCLERFTSGAIVNVHVHGVTVLGHTSFQGYNRRRPSKRLAWLHIIGLEGLQCHHEFDQQSHGIFSHVHAVVVCMERALYVSNVFQYAIVTLDCLLMPVKSASLGGSSS
jgi:hypothetical protein